MDSRNDIGTFDLGLGEEQGNLCPSLEVLLLDWPSFDLFPILISTISTFSDDELDIPICSDCRRGKGDILWLLSLTLDLVAAQAGDKVPLVGEVEGHGEAACATNDMMVLTAVHQNQGGELETLAVGPGKVFASPFARTAEVEVFGVQRSPQVGEFDSSGAVTTLVADEPEALFVVVGIVADSFINDLGVARWGCCFAFGFAFRFTFNAEIFWVEIVRLDDRVTPT